MSVEKILSEWKGNRFKPVYWLEGEEEYQINQLVDYAEHRMLPDSEKEFNLTVFYGKDADWISVVNACCRYPMFAERQVVLLKEAQQMRDIERLEGYIQKPLSSTIFIVAYKEKKLDGRSKLAKLIRDKAELVTTTKIYDSQLPDWTSELLHSRGLSISPKALALLIDHVGNDLTRLDHEVGKIQVNLGTRKNIIEDDIEQFVGISKEFNVFELQDALARKDAPKALRIIQYFDSNPKAAPIQLILPSLYTFFSRAYMIFGLPGRDEKTVASSLGIKPFFVKDYLQATQNYGFQGIEQALLLLHAYNLKSVGVNSVALEDGALLKELLAKIFL